MPISSYTGKETVEGRHRDAKFNISQIVAVLLQEERINVETAKMIIGQLGRIEDDALSLFSSYAGKKIEYEIGQGKEKKSYTCELLVTEKGT